jgi:hypothetical protein
MLETHWQLEEHVENPLKLDGNIIGTHWEQQKSNIPTVPQKKQNLVPLWCMLLHFIGCKIIFYLLVFFAILAWVIVKAMNYGCIL